jgi:transglutaminase-like putative cysteine protease
MKEGEILRVDLKKPILYISILTLIITVVFFISIPRISGGIWSKGHLKSIKSVGFSEKVRLGAFGAFKLDHTVIMRVELNPVVPGPYYWRGMTLDYFDGTSWISTLMKTRRVVKKVEEEFIVWHSSKSIVTQKIMLEPIDSDIIFGLNRVSSIKGSFRRLERDPATSLFVWKKRSKRIQYTVRSEVDETIPVKPSEIRNWMKYMQVPDSMRDKIKTLTEDVLNEASTEYLSNLQVSKTIESYLKNNYRYSLSVKAPDDKTNPLLYFLFQSKTGFCEHYATAMALMLRSIGIPARVVTGFIGGELNTYGDYIIVRQSNAHSWVEAVIGDSWRRFDPTPSVLSQPPSIFALYLDMIGLMWNRYVIAFSISDQKEIVKAVSMPFMLPQIPDFRLQWFSKIFIGILLIATAVVFFFL